MAYKAKNLGLVNWLYTPRRNPLLNGGVTWIFKKSKLLIEMYVHFFSTCWTMNALTKPLRWSKLPLPVGITPILMNLLKLLLSAQGVVRPSSPWRRWTWKRLMSCWSGVASIPEKWSAFFLECCPNHPTLRDLFLLCMISQTSVKYVHACILLTVAVFNCL